jgi:hypothetical protein
MSEYLKRPSAMIAGVLFMWARARCEGDDGWASATYIWYLDLLVLF